MEKDLDRLINLEKKIKDLLKSLGKEITEEKRLEIDKYILEIDNLVLKLEKNGEFKGDLKRFKELNFDNLFRHRTPSDDSIYPKRKHMVLLNDLHKVILQEDIKIKKNSIILPKIDGLSLVFWRNGTVLSRGDGECGNDYSSKFKDFYFNKYIKKLFDEKKDLLGIRGEFYLRKSKYPPEKANIGYLNGLLQKVNYDKEKFKEIEFYPFDLIYENHKDKIEKVIVTFLKIGFKIPFIKLIFDIVLNKEQFEKISDQFQKDEDLVTDGLVVHQNDNILGVKNEIMLSTKVKGINYKISDKLKVVPFLEIEPIFFKGKNYTKITMSNVNKLISSFVKINDMIKVKVDSGNANLSYVENLESTKKKRQEFAYLNFLMKEVFNNGDFILEDKTIVLKNMNYPLILTFLIRLKMKGYGKKSLLRELEKINFKDENNIEQLNGVIKNVSDNLRKKIKEKIRETSNQDLAILSLSYPGFTTSKINQLLISMFIIKMENDYIKEIEIKHGFVPNSNIEKTLLSVKDDYKRFYNFFKDLDVS